MAIWNLDRAARSAKDFAESMERLQNIKPLGAALTGQIERLGAKASDFDNIRASWEQLQASFGKKKPSKAATAEWRDAVVTHFSAVNAAAAATQARIEKVKKSVLEFAGFSSLPALAGQTAKAGVKAAATVESERSKLGSAGLSKEQLVAVEGQAGAMARRYGAFKGDMMAMYREAFQILPIPRDAQGNIAKEHFEPAMKMSESVAQYRSSMAHLFGSDRAGDLTQKMLSSLATLGIDDPKAGVAGMDAAVKLSRAFGGEIPHEQLFLAAKQARDAGKMINEDFFLGLAPAFALDRHAKTRHAGLYSAFGKLAGDKVDDKVAAEFGKYGLIDPAGRLVGQDLMKNTGLWLESVFKPALEKGGFDVSNRKGLSEAIARVSGGQIKTDQADKYLAELDRYQGEKARVAKADGLDTAARLREKDPLMAFDAVVGSLKNFADVLNGSGQMTAALNSLAHYINVLADALRNAGPVVQSTVTGGLLVGGSLLAARMMGLGGGSIWGLAANAGRWLIPRLGAPGMIGYGLYKMINGEASPPATEQAKTNFAPQNAQARLRKLRGEVEILRGLSPSGEGFVERVLRARETLETIDQDIRNAKARPEQNATSQQLIQRTETDAGDLSRTIQQIEKRAREAGTSITGSLNVTAAPIIDTSSIDIGLEKARQLVAYLNQISGFDGARITIGAPRNGSTTPIPYHTDSVFS